MGRIASVLAVLVVALLVLATWQERRYGAAEAGQAARADSIRHLARTTDSLQRALARQLPAATRWKTRWDTIVNVDTLERTDTIPVPVEVLVTADSAIEACHVALGTCVALQDSLGRAAGLWRRQYEGAERLRGRPWTAAGLVREAGGALGVFVDRDVWKLRLGASVSQDPVAGARLQLRIGLRW